MRRPCPADLLVFCEAEREALLATLARRTGYRPEWPADALDAVIEDVLYYGVSNRPLPGGHLGWCDYDRRTIVINTRMPSLVLPNTDISGVLHSTKAHEVGHVRLPHHEAELRAQDDGAPPDPDAEAQREFEADFFAGVFVAPTHLLWAQPEVADLADAIYRGHPFTSDALWDFCVALGRRFKVTGSLLATRLAHLGILDKDGRTLTPAPLFSTVH